MALNSSKTNFIYFHSKHSKTNDLQLQIGNNKINCLEHAKILGIHVDEHLTWSNHVNSLSKKLNSVCFNMSCLTNIISMETKLTLYYGYFQSLLSYGIAIWGGASSLDKLLIIQKRMLRIITMSPPKKSCKQTFKSLKILTAPSLYIYTLLINVFKNKEKYFMNNYDYKYNTRNKNKILQYPLHRTTHFERSSVYMEMKFFNKIPNDWKEFELLKFSKLLKTHLINRAYYTIQDFLNDNEIGFNNI